MNINHYLRELQFINNNIDILNHPEHGSLLELNRFNEFFFGTNKIPNTVCRRYLDEEGLIFIKKNINNKFEKDYIILSKSKKYLDLVGKLLHQENRYLLINNYIYQNLNLNNLDFNGKIYNLWISLKKYLHNNKTIICNKILNAIGIKYFKGILNNCDNLIKTMYLSFRIFKHKEIHFSCGFENLNNIENYINLNNPNLKLIVKYFEKIITMSSKEDFIISNLTDVTNNESFSNLLYNSKDNEEKFITDLDFISKGINIKYKKHMRKEHIKDFLEKYNNRNIYMKKNNSYFLNFEGVNKYFLSMDQKYLKTDIDEVRDFYYLITKELIQSYENLFKFLDI